MGVTKEKTEYTEKPEKDCGTFGGISQGQTGQKPLHHTAQDAVSMGRGQADTGAVIDGADTVRVLHRVMKNGRCYYNKVIWRREGE